MKNKQKTKQEPGELSKKEAVARLKSGYYDRGAAESRLKQSEGKKNAQPKTVPQPEDNAAEPTSAPSKNGSYSPLKLVLIEKSIEMGEEYHAKKLSDDAIVSYPTVLDLVHGVKKRYGKRTLMAIANTLNVSVDRITP